MAKSKTKLTSKAMIEHGAAEHPTHLRDKARKEARRQQEFIRVPYQTKEIYGFPYSCAPFLGAGEQWKYENDKRITMAAIPWAEENNQMRLDRSFEFFLKTDKKKKAKRRTTRPIKPFSGLVVTLAPWVSAYLHVLLLKKGAKGRHLVSYYLFCISEIARKIALERTRNEIPFASFHYDTDDIHLNLHLTCVNEENRRIGDIRLRTAGKAAIGYHRQISVKAYTDKNQTRAKRSLDTYRERAEKSGLPERIAKLPLDIEIAEKIDALAEDQFGEEPAFRQAINTYILFVMGKIDSIMPTELIEQKIAGLQSILDQRKSRRSLPLPKQRDIREI